MLCAMCYVLCAMFSQSCRAIEFYPHGRYADGYVSCFLRLDSDVPRGLTVGASFVLTIHNADPVKEKVITAKAGKFSHDNPKDTPRWGWKKLLSHESLFSDDEGWILDNALAISVRDILVDSETIILHSKQIETPQ